jgi:murein L,D-transpeptidase YcbB/YkuD
MPESGTVKPGTEHADIALLRKRLKVEAQSADNEKLYDARLEEAVKAFQEEKGLKANGILNDKTRKALNRAGEPKRADPKGRTDLILVNMERWRWLPEDLSDFYVMNNIPEFISRVYKNGDEAFKTKIIVGQPTWPTPVLTSSMEFVIFHPEWGVPDGIKVKELLPRLKRAGGGGGFFEELFGGGSSGGARVLQAYKLQPTLNGHPVDADKVDWNHVDIRQFSFVQPAGGENPLGFVKFRFPNRHDVYMHDTPQRDLFRQTFRALSHGCMRVENPKKLAEVLLAEDHGWTPDDVDRAIAGSKDEITLKKPIPVYLVYFTAVANKDGRLEIYDDIYGHDSKLMQALEGRPVRFSPPDHSKEEVTASDDATPVPVSDPGKKKGKKGQQQAAQKQKGGETAGDILSNALSGLLAN